MKSKKSILGVALTLMLLGSLLAAAVPVSAGTLDWGGEYDVPDDAALLLAPDTHVTSLAVMGDTIYAASSASDNECYKSTDGGKTWTDLSTTVDFPTGTTIKLVAVAPDDADKVVIVTTGHVVYYSSNGGAKWGDLERPDTNATISSIDLSPALEGIYYIAAGGTSDGSNAELYTLKLTMAQNWTARSDMPTASTSNFTASQTVVAAVKFSPNFATDKTITCISGQATKAYLQVFRYEEGAYTWNGAIAFFSATDWVTGIEITEITAITSGVASASIAMSPEYLGTEEGTRVAFVGLAGTGAAAQGGVVRFSDSYQKEFTTWAAGEEGQIHSVSYHDSEKLLAGDYNEAKVYRCLTPMATTPRLERLNTLKQPGGEQYTIVAWAGDSVVAGTSGDESAFAVSTDDGYAFNDIGLIDTYTPAGEVANMSDVAVSADGKKYYLTTYDLASSGTNDVSVWLYESRTWSRVLSMRDVTTANAPFLVRIAPEDDSVVYVSSTDTTNMWVSKNSGLEKWSSVPAYKLDKVQDFVVESADVVYAIDTNGCSKTTNAGASWGTKKTIDGLTAHMITLAPNNDILVGGSDSHVAFSKDGGDTFVRILSGIYYSGTFDVQVVADKDYADNNIIYAAGYNVVVRGEAKKTESWDSREPDAFADNTTGYTAGYRVKGMAQYENVIYVLTADGSNSILWRALNLKVADTGSLALWGYSTESGESLGAEPQALKMAPEYKDGPRFFAICTRAAPHDELYRITDPIATVGPTLRAPAEGTSIGVNPVTGKAYNVTFSWDRYSEDEVDECELQIATDSAFDGVIYEGEFTGITKDIVTKMVGPTAAAAQMVDFVPETTYYWRTRISGTTEGPFISAWSEGRSFTIGTVEVAPPVEIVIPPAAAAPEITVTPPPVIVELPPTPAPITPAYIWAIVIIGAILVIAVLVLIVRTRRIV